MIRALPELPFKRLAGFFLLFSAFVYLIIPSATGTFILGTAAGRLARFSGILIFASLLCAYGCYLISQLGAAPLSIPLTVSKSTSGLRSFQLFIQLLCSAIIVFDIVTNLNAPLDVDENVRVVSWLSTSFWDEANPFLGTHIHSISHLTSYLSLKLFGISKIALRAPALLFSVGMLIVTNFLCLRFLTPFTGILAFSHFASNGFLLNYLHSARGYPAVLFFAVSLLTIMIGYQKQAPFSFKRSPVWVTVIFHLIIFAQPFGGLFAALALLAYLQTSNSETSQRLVWGALAGVPILVLYYISVVFDLQSAGDFWAGAFPSLGENISRVFGFSNLLHSKLFLLTVIAVFVISMREGKDPRRNLFSWMVILNVVFFLVTISILEVLKIESRWMAIFTLPVLFMVGELANSLEGRWTKRLLIPLVIFCTVGLPLMSRAGVKEFLRFQFRSYDQFIEESREITAPVSENCYYFPEDSDVSRWAETFYFHDREKSQKTCRKSYVLWFGAVPIDEESLKTHYGDLEVVLSGERQVLFKLSSKPL